MNRLESSSLDRLLDAYQQALGHELPNRFVGIQGLIEVVLEEEEACSSQARGLLAQVASQAQQAHHLVRALAEMGRVARKPGDITRFFAGLAWEEARARARWQAGTLNLQLSAMNPLPEIRASQEAVTRVLTELLLDGISRARERSWFGARLSGQSVGERFWHAELCEDAPVGSISPQQMMLDPFAAVDTNQEPRFGLFLARELTLGWGGELSWSSTDQGGAFHLTLPLAPTISEATSL